MSQEPFAQIQELGEEDLLDAELEVLDSRTYAHIGKPFPFTRLINSEEPDSYTDEETNESDWSIEEEPFTPAAPVIEEIEEVQDSLEEQAARQFVTLFYSLLHTLQNTPNTPEVQMQKLQKMASFFHPESWVTLQVRVLLPQ